MSQAPSISLSRFLPRRRHAKKTRNSENSGTDDDGNSRDDSSAMQRSSAAPECASGTSSTMENVPQSQTSDVALLGYRSHEEGTLSSEPSSLPKTSNSSLIPPERLWDRAYDSLRDDEPSLVKAYEKILSRKLDETCSTSKSAEPQNKIEQTDRAARQMQMRQLIQAGLKKTEREARVKRGIGDAMHVVLSAKEIIDSAVQAVPQAALAWTGVCLALEILVNPIKATETNRKGIIYVVTRMDWYWNLTSLLLKENAIDSESYAGLLHELEKRIVDLYKALLSYQMMSVCSSYRNRGLDFLRSIIQLDNWDGSLKNIYDAESALRQDSTEYNTRQVTSYLEKLVLIAKNLETKLIQDNHACQDATSESPRCHWIVPFGRNKDFVGREEILAQLLKRIPPSVDQDDCQRTAIEGLGGVGKTQIALEAAFRVRDEHQDCSVFWVPAVDATTFENAYREIGRQLKVEGIDENKADVRALVKAALSHESSDSWLLIVDNADDVELLFGNGESTALCDSLPFSRKGSILFTTRNHEAVVRLDISDRNVIIMAEMSRPEALDLLLRYLNEIQTRNAESTTNLLDFLADLPLAIKQASAYMAKTGISTAKYLGYCRSSDETLIKLLSKDFEDRGRYKSIKNAVAATWLISFEHISRDNQLAAKYLKFMCFLAGKEIPLSLLPPGDDELEVVEAIGTLKAYAFITEREESGTFDIHRLVRLAMRNWLAGEGAQAECITEVIQRLAEAFPFPKHESRDVWIRYLPHAQSALDFRQHSTDKKAVSRLLFNVADSYRIIGKYEEAERMHRQTLELRKEVLGQEHPNTLLSMNNLAIVHYNRGKYKEAEEMHRQTLELKQKVLGEEHPDTLDSMNNLANVFGRLAKYEQAKEMHQQALQLRKKVLGEKDPETLWSMNNLALVLYNQGKYREVEEIHRQTLELRENVLGKEHPDTLTSIDNLALVLGSQGKYKKAEKMHQQALELREKALGREHPDTLWSMNNLAFIFRRQGKYKDAAQMYQEALELREKVLGKEHPDTLWSMNNLALVLDDQGKYKEAEDMHRQTLKLREKVLGKEHPNTLTSMSNLGDMLDDQGKYKEAEKIHQQTLELRQKVLGKEHPNTLLSMSNLGNVLNDQGKYKEAEQIHKQTLELREKVLGKEHPDTLSSMNNLALVLDNLGKHKEAEQMHRQTLELRETVLGKNHPDTFASMDNLANLLDNHGNGEEAKRIRCCLKIETVA